MTTAARSRAIGSAVIWGGAALLLLAPAVAMHFTTEVAWTASDFVVFALMLGAAGGTYEFLSRRSGSWRYRAGAALAVVTGFFLIWVSLAVGIIGSENYDANMMYAGVLAVAIGGSIVAHLRRGGMAKAMLAAAAAQLLVGIVALTFGLGSEGVAWPRDVIGATLLITAMWSGAALLFGVNRPD